MFVYLPNTSHFIHSQSVRQKKWNIRYKTNKYRWHFQSKPHQTTSLNRTSVQQSKYFRQTSFLDLKLLALSFILAFTTNLITLDFLSSIPPGWVVMFLDSNHTVFTFRSWLDLLGVVLAFWISILEIFKSLHNVWHRVTYITSFERHLRSSSSYTLNFCPNLVK